uniref:Scaffolding anchor of CK1 domain-containing protein n=1 Tax=Strigops habroptila TaxID=2489341 RepID=A0A672VG18_STRHB
METSSLLSSLHDECRSDNYIEPHYKEWYRVAIDALIEGGLEAYKEFLSKERCSEFLADEEIDYILNNVHKLPQNTVYSSNHAIDDTSSSGTYWPIESDVEAPNLDLGWPYLMPGVSGGTNIDLLFHPPRAQPYTIKETIRKMIRDARKGHLHLEFPKAHPAYTSVIRRCMYKPPFAFQCQFKKKQNQTPKNVLACRSVCPWAVLTF